MKTSIASLFGLTQREMAMALGIGLSQWSMYESGRRNLPVRAQHLLNEMTAHLNMASPNRKKKTKSNENENRAAHLKSLLDDNAFRQLALARKMEAIAKKRTLAERFERFDDFVKKHSARQKRTGATPIFVETNQKQRKREVNDNDQFFRYEVKQALLVHEQKFLESMLASLKGGLPKQNR